jgi:hypothetical protein
LGFEAQAAIEAVAATISASLTARLASKLMRLPPPETIYRANSDARMRINATENSDCASQWRQSEAEQSQSPIS